MTSAEFGSLFVKIYFLIQLGSKALSHSISLPHEMFKETTGVDMILGRN
jgi:hypothetical protein